MDGGSGPRAGVSENKREAELFYDPASEVSLPQYIIGQSDHKPTQIQGEGTYTPTFCWDRVKTICGHVIQPPYLLLVETWTIFSLL